MSFKNKKEYKEAKQKWKSTALQTRDPAGYQAFKSNESAFLSAKNTAKNNKGNSSGGDQLTIGSNDGVNTGSKGPGQRAWNAKQRDLVKEGDPLSIKTYNDLVKDFGSGRVTKLLDKGKLELSKQLQVDMQSNPTQYSDKQGVFATGAEGEIDREQALNYAYDNAFEVTGPGSLEDTLKEGKDHLLNNFKVPKLYTGERFESREMRESKKKWINEGKKGGAGYSQYVDDDGKYQSRLGIDGTLKYDKDGNKYNIKTPVKSEDSLEVTKTKNKISKLYDSLGIKERSPQGQMKKSVDRLENAMGFNPSKNINKRKNNYTKSGLQLLGIK